MQDVDKRLAKVMRSCVSEGRNGGTVTSTSCFHTRLQSGHAQGADLCVVRGVGME
jgi:hypothetical protein